MTDKLMLIDSNILVYAFDKDENDKNQTASRILEKVIKNEINIALSTQNISEFYVNISKKIEKPISTKDARTIIENLISLSNIRILKIRESTILTAIDISTRYNISYWDSLIVSIMHENNIKTIFTENEKDFEKISWLKIINPFKK